MKKFIQNVVSPFVMFSAGILLIGCEQANSPDSTENRTSQSSEVSEQVSESVTASAETSKAELKSGNMFYIVRDVADMQLKAGDYVEYGYQNRILLLLLTMVFLLGYLPKIAKKVI